MLCINEIIEKLRDVLSSERDNGKVFDKEIANVLDLTSVNFATMKKRNSIPFSNILDFCALKKISIKSFDLSYKGDEDLLQIRQKIETQNQNVFSLEKKLDRSTNIVSPYTGTVLETKVGIWEMTEQRKPILSLELTGDDFKNLESVIYVAAADGKKVKPGMDVQVSPTTVRAEEA